MKGTQHAKRQAKPCLRSLQIVMAVLIFWELAAVDARKQCLSTCWSDCSVTCNEGTRSRQRRCCDETYTCDFTNIPPELEEEACNEGLCPDLDLYFYKNVTLEAQVSTGVDFINDLLVFDNKLVALVREGDFSTGTRKLVELDDAGHEVRVICSEKLGSARRATSSGGKIVVTSRDKGVLSVTLDGVVETIVGGEYEGCCTADDGSVYAVRKVPNGQPVIIDIITTNEKLIGSVQTHITSSGWIYTVVPGSASHVALVGSYRDNRVYEVSLSDGSTLNTYGYRVYGGGAGDLNFPVLCFKLNHDVVVADYANDQLQILNLMISESWSIFNTSVELREPWAAVNKQGKLYVAGMMDGNSVIYILN